MNNYLNQIKQLVDVVKKLRSPDEGCPWDVKQTHESLKNYLIEESYEFLEAVEEDDYELMEEELGDILFHVVIHSVIAEGNNSFSLESLTDKITKKMVRRHPHVFGDATVDSVKEVWENWDKIKKKEKHSNGNKSLLENIPKHLPALLRAEKIQKRAARAGFDWDELDGVWDKIEEEVREIKEALAEKEKKKEHIKEEVGDLLFTVVNLARKLDVDPEDALQGTNKKFTSRFIHIEDEVRKSGKQIEDVSLDELGGLWEDAKKQN